MYIPLATISHLKRAIVLQPLLADSFVIDSLRLRGKNIEGREGGAYTAERGEDLYPVEVGFRTKEKFSVQSW
jgi:hypothetical protein